MKTIIEEILQSFCSRPCFTGALPSVPWDEEPTVTIPIPAVRILRPDTGPVCGQLPACDIDTVVDRPTGIRKE